MTRNRIRLSLVMFLAVTGQAFAHSGHTNWGPWRFDWEVKDGSGLALRYLYYNGEEVLHKGNLPVIKVQYNSSCGPYADRIYWESLLNISNCGNAKVCQRSFISGGRSWLEIGVLAAIGSYRLYQAYYLSNDGYLDAKLWSRGLQCNIDHRHHPYWRMDFDINGAPLDQIFVYDNNRPNEGWGPGWHKYTNEFQAVKNPPTNRTWFVRDNPTGHGVWVFPREFDGFADGFSNLDVAGRLYRASQDKAWEFGTGELGYNFGADIQEKDVVLWYVAHLNHNHHEGGEVWHWSGPLFKVHR